MQIKNQKEKPRITVGEFVESARDKIEIEVIAGKNGLPNRFLDSARMQKLGLALAGFADYTRAGRMQIVGQSEISYLAQLEKKRRIEAIENLDLKKICCILITKNLELPKEFVAVAEANDLPILQTPTVSSAAVSSVSKLLLEILAPQAVVHGVLVGMYGLGILLSGESGIGKSECALDLIARGHRLISDDSVVVKKIGEFLEGSSPELTSEHLEIRGLGIINVRDLFGVSAVGKCIKIELLIELKKWTEMVKIERLGLDTDEEEFFGAKIKKFVLPVSAGRNLSTLVETAVRVHLLREAGFEAARKLVEKHAAIVARH